MGLAVSVRLDVRSVRPHAASRVHLVVVLEATADDAQRYREPRAPSRTVLALDVSGSMQGEPLAQVVRSVDRMLDTFAADDEVAVVAFSDEAARIAPPVRVDDAGKRLVRARVARLVAGGNTNVEAGLDLAASLHADAPAAARRGVVLLSDGVPNRGAYTADGLREVVKHHRPGISFFSLGYGKDHCEDVLAAVGEAGGGGYELVSDPATCARAFARALGSQADVVASGIELVVAPADGAELVRFLAREEMRVGRDGVIVALPDMVAGARRVVVAEVALRAPGDQRFVASVADVSARSKTGVAPSERVDVEIAERDAVVDASALREVLLVRADVVREEARGHADRGQFAPAAVVLRKLLAEIEKCPGFVLDDGSPLAEAYELLVDEAVAMERKPNVDEYSAFRKSTVATKLAAMGPESARDRGPASRRFVEHAAGDLPEAYLVAGAVRHRLREENVLGRTSTADVVLAQAGVSRRHAEVYAIEGKFLVADLGSTNTTTINGMPLGRVPHALVHGDVLRIGDAELRYEEVVRNGRS